VFEANEIELNRPVLSLVLDGDGGGNWSSLELKPGALPFVPQNVTLRSVKLIDGVLAIYNREVQPVARADAINGELSADALRGPYKFKGTAKWDGAVRDIKFASTEPEADGAFRIKSVTRIVNSPNSYALDAKVEDFSGKPKLTGELTAKLAVPGSEASAAPEKGAEAPVMDFKSRVVANATGAAFEEIALTLENAAEPQLITGRATAAWAGEPRLDIVLAAKWLDIDRLSGAGQDGATFSKIKQFGLGVLLSLAGDGAASAKIDLEQVKLGGETAGGLRVDAERKGGVLHLKGLRASLPGGARLDVSGDVKDDAGKVSFAGSGFVHGSNLARLLAWAAKSGAAIDIKADGPFSAEGRLLVSDTRVELTEATADLGGRPFSGEVKVSDEGGHRVAVTLQGARLDSSELFPGTASELTADIRRIFGFAAAETGAGGGAASAGENPNGSDIDLRLLAGELKHGTETYRDVDAKIGLEGGEIRVPFARFTTAGGLSVSLEAHIKDASGDPKGTLSYELNGRTSDALKDIGSVLGLGGVVSPERLAALNSAKVAGLVRLGERGKGMADASIDGTISTARITGQTEFDGGLGAWRTAPSRFNVTLKADDLGGVLAALGQPVPPSSPAAAQPAELIFASSGTLAATAATFVDIKSKDMDLVFNGSATWPEVKPATYAGMVKLKARDVRQALALANLPVAAGVAGIPAEGALDVQHTGTSTTLSTRQLALGPSMLKGTAAIARDPQGGADIKADLTADRITLAGLLGPVMDGQNAANAPADDLQRAPVVWPQGNFDFDALKSVRGDLHIGFGVLQLADGLTAHDGAMAIALQPGKVSLTSISGKAANGTFKASGELEKVAGSAAITATLRLDGAELASFSNSARGRATLDLSLSGRAPAFATLMSVAAGKGSITLDSARLPALSSAAVAQIADAVMQTKIPNEPDAIQAALAAALSSADADAGTRTIGLVIADGSVKADPFVIETAEGRVSVTTTVDAASLAIDSAWRSSALLPPAPIPVGSLPPAVPAPAKPPLPAVSVVYAGRLSDLKALSVSIEVAELQRELTVRQLERNLEELERLRRQDAERIKQRDLERRRALDAAAAARLPQPPAGQPPAATAVPQPAVLPPVLPSSNGVPPSSAAAPPGSSQQNPGLAASDAAAVAPGGAPVQQRVTIETLDGVPIEQPVAPQSAAPVPNPMPPAVQPARAPSAPRPPKLPRRTTADEIMRSPLGGFP
jgi:AsmA-like C-terminal region